MSVKSIVMPEHIALFISQMNKTELYTYLSRKGYAPSNYSWRKFSYMVSEKRMHKFEVEMMERAYADYTD